MEPKPQPQLSDFNFETKNAEDMREALKGHKDVLTPAAKVQHEHLQKQTCHSCGNKLELSISPHPFQANDLLPRYVGRCATCNTDGIIIGV